MHSVASTESELRSARTRVGELTDARSKGQFERFVGSKRILIAHVGSGIRRESNKRHKRLGETLPT